MKKIVVAVAVIHGMGQGIYDFADDFMATIEKTLTAI